MARTLKPDRSLFLLTLSLVFFGLVMVFSASAVMAKERFGDPNAFFFKQLLAVGIGLASMFVLMKIDYHRYRHPAIVFSLLGIVVALLMAVFFFRPMNHAYRWIQLPGFSFQPSELAKLATVLFLAYFLDMRREQINEVRSTLLPLGSVLGLLAALILIEPDLGTAVALLGVAVILLFVAGLSLWWVFASAIAAVPFFYFFVVRVPWRWERMTAFWDPWADPKGTGFHIIQSLISVGSGGVAGLGLMEGKQKLFFLPEAHTDFIFAVVGEELGLIGTGMVLLLFVAFLTRGIRSSLRAPDLFGLYLGLGITVMVCLQAFINMSVVVGLMPTKGIPLPFLSYGGSSFAVMLAAVGILLNVSQQGTEGK